MISLSSNLDDSTGQIFFILTLFITGMVGLLVHIYQTPKTSNGLVITMREKYSYLIDFLLQNENAHLEYCDINKATVSIKNRYDKFSFTLKENSKTLDVKWILEDIVIGKHSLNWSFPKNGDQNKMSLKITIDLDNYRDSNFGD